jgi:GT2 family glycosyltransferase
MKNTLLENSPRVAVIMLNWNTPEMTIVAINSLLSSDYPNFRIHLTDNGSIDNSFEIIKKEFGNKIQVHRLEKNQGYVGGMNFCLEQGLHSDPHYFLIMNNDVIIDQKALSILVETARKYNDRCVVTGKVYFYDKPDILQSVGNEFDRKTMNETRIGFGVKDEGQFETETERAMIDDIFMLLPSSIYKEIGGYSTYFYLNYEQTDLILRMKEKGYKAIFTPNAKLWHKGSFSTGGLGNPYMMFWEGKSSVIIHYLYQTGYDFYCFYFRFLYRLTWSLIKGVVKGVLRREHKIKPRIALLRGFLSGTAWLFHKKVEKGYNPYSTN